MTLAESIGALRLQERAYSTQHELLTLLEVDASELIKCEKRWIEIAQKIGAINILFSLYGRFTKLLILSGEIQEAEHQLEKAYEVLKNHNEVLRESSYISYVYRMQSFLHYTQKNVARAIESQHCREDFLWSDLAWLEMLYRHSNKDNEFRAFCDKLTGQTHVKQWYLIRAIPESIVWDEEESFTGHFGQQWRWVDPLQKGSYTVENGLEITPVMGTGVYSNVYVPRLMQEIERDFTIEAVLDYRNGLTKAGGILVYQDDHTLIRLGVGIQFDGEITLTVKSPEQGFFITARGLLDAESIILRLKREQNRFTAWCSDGYTWYCCGRANVKMQEKIQVGLFAECTYRDFSLVRCTATPVRFKEVRVKKISRNFS